MIKSQVQFTVKQDHESGLKQEYGGREVNRHRRKKQDSPQHRESGLKQKYEGYEDRKVNRPRHKQLDSPQHRESGLKQKYEGYADRKVYGPRRKQLDSPQHCESGLKQKYEGHDDSKVYGPRRKQLDNNAFADVLEKRDFKLLEESYPQKTLIQRRQLDKDKILEPVEIHNNSALPHKKSPVPLIREILLEDTTQSLDLNRYPGIESVDNHDVFDMEASIFGYRKGPTTARSSIKMQADKSRNHCSSNHYNQYFETILSCQDIRMKTIIHFEGTNCNYNWIERTLESFAKCVLEKRNNKLPCEINDLDQMNDYLENLGKLLDRSRRLKGKKCPAVKPCYGLGFPMLFRCADVVYRQLNSSLKGHTSLSEKGLSETVECLKPTWPHCNVNASLLAALSIYVPIGVGLKDVLKEKAECTYLQGVSATEEIYECMDRNTRKIEESINKTTEKLHWQVLPLTVCVTIHPITLCELSKPDEFKKSVKGFLRGIQTRLIIYMRLFDDPKDIEQGTKCISQFISPSVDKCLSVMFQYMTKFQKGSAKSSDYPSKCMEDTFKTCGDIDTFHLLMKKSMNVSEKDNGKTNKVSATTEKVCLKTEKHGELTLPTAFSYHN
ncbi:uncharacterized protein CDAR_280801 [Caerostris darwini]|uniref:Uncharacterized protein n=1 Tax=Caerostris darwini TaxID=1538125 RepID=A0AAV4MDQ1_9ARAC|nr:uncharacterized protein CDAR_280801 [Caerostris darwini]